MNPVTVSRYLILLLAVACYAISWAGEITWIDVRTAEEYSQEHVPAAINIPYDQISEGIGVLNLQPDDVIYLYCGSGRRAGIAKESLEAMGFTEVVNLGGLDDALAKAEETLQ